MLGIATVASAILVPAGADGAEKAPASSGAVNLVIDYSNGAQKHFSGIPWTYGMRILGAIEAAKSIAPGLTSQRLTDRGWMVVITAVDNVKGSTDRSAWLAWVNKRFVGSIVDADEGMPEDKRRRLQDAATLQPGVFRR